MSAVDWPQSGDRGVCSSTRRVSVIEQCRRAGAVVGPGAAGFARCVGRVGALAIALGVGSAVVDAFRAGDHGPLPPPTPADEIRSSIAMLTGDTLRISADS